MELRQALGDLTFPGPSVPLRSAQQFYLRTNTTTTTAASINQNGGMFKEKEQKIPADFKNQSYLAILILRLAYYVKVFDVSPSRVFNADQTGITLIFRSNLSERWELLDSFEIYPENWRHK
jgi:hypothetical protein